MSSCARPAASKRKVSVRVISPLRSVMATACELSDDVQRQISGRPFGTSRASGTARSLVPPPCAPSSQSTSAATTLRYACSEAPPRNAQRQSPAAATVATRRLLRCSSVRIGCADPRRASRAVRATVAVRFESRATVTAVAGGKESHRTPARAAVNGEDRGGSTYQSPLWPFVDRKSTRLNSSHTVISYAVFCLKKKKQ